MSSSVVIVDATDEAVHESVDSLPAPAVVVSSDVSLPGKPRSVFSRRQKKAKDDQHVNFGMLFLIAVIIVVPILYVNAVNSAANRGVNRMQSVQATQAAIVGSAPSIMPDAGGTPPGGGGGRNVVSADLSGFTGVLASPTPVAAPVSVWGDGVGCEYQQVNQFISVCVADFEP